MALPNSHVGIFTQVPERVVRSWGTIARLVETNEPVAEDFTQTLHSPIRSVKVEIAFADLRNTSTDRQFDLTDDLADDRIACWQQTRKFYAEIETAVNNVVASFTDSLQQEARKSKQRAAQALIRERTTVYPWRATHPFPSPARLNVQTTRAPSTILPSDSVTTITDRSPSRKSEKKHKQQRATQPSTAKSLLSYISKT